MAEAQVIFSTKNLHRSFGKIEVLAGVTLGFFAGAKIGIIGRNGSGKSTLLRILAGEDKEYDGTVTFQRGVRVGWVPQEPQLDETKDVRGNVEDGAALVRNLVVEYEAVAARLGEPLDDKEMEKAYARMADLQEKIDVVNAWEIDRHIDQAMHALGCPPGDSPVSTLSGGERRRVAICRTLLSHPDVLLLDEPTNHLDADSVAWLESHLAEYSGTVLLVTHDRYFLDHLVGWMLEIDRGQGNPYEGNYSTYLDQKGKRLEQEARAEGARRKALARELEWINQTPRARAKKQKARVNAFEELRAERDAHPDELPELAFPSGARLGDFVLRLSGVSKGYDGRTLFKDLSFELPPGGIVGVIGPNGTGKTTLLRLIIESEPPDEGVIEIGPNTEICYVDQSRHELEAKNSVYQEISEGYESFRVGKKDVNARAYVSRFGFKGEDQEKRVGDLSGGQRNRVQMAKMLRRGGNVVLLDEPTNDLDIPTLRLLEEALMSFPGCAIVVSHDRYFLDRVATHILAFPGDGTSRFFEGSYEAYADRISEERRERGEPDPTRGTHRRFRS